MKTKGKDKKSSSHFPSRGTAILDVTAHGQDARVTLALT